MAVWEKAKIALFGGEKLNHIHEVSHGLPGWLDRAWETAKRTAGPNQIPTLLVSVPRAPVEDNLIMVRINDFAALIVLAAEQQDPAAVVAAIAAELEETRA